MTAVDYRTRFPLFVFQSCCRNTSIFFFVLEIKSTWYFHAFAIPKVNSFAFHYSSTRTFHRPSKSERLPLQSVQFYPSSNVQQFPYQALRKLHICSRMFWLQKGFARLFHCRCPDFFVFMISFDVQGNFE